LTFRFHQLREDFDKGIVTTLSPDICPHDIATLLKEFFRDLPEPLLCRHLYKAFLQTQCE
jgi:RhoGAP domain